MLYSPVVATGSVRLVLTHSLPKTSKQKCFFLILCYSYFALFLRNPCCPREFCKEPFTPEDDEEKLVRKIVLFCEYVSTVIVHVVFSRSLREKRNPHSVHQLQIFSPGLPVEWKIWRTGGTRQDVQIQHGPVQILLQKSSLRQSRVALEVSVSEHSQKVSPLQNWLPRRQGHDGATASRAS